MVPTHLKGGAAEDRKGWLFNGKHLHEGEILYCILSV